MRPHSKPSLMRRLVLAGTVLAILAGIGAAPALADDWGHRGWDDGWRRHEWREHEWRRHEWFEHHGFFAPGYYYPPRYYYPPSYAYVPPPVVYPPPVVTPGLSLGFYFR
jgi:hypothetical protein